MKFSGTNYASMEDFLKAHGCNPDDLLQSRYYAYDFSFAYQFLIEAIQKSGLIYIIGDYDVDGILSTQELDMIICALGGHSVRRIPRRISEGYGLNIKILDEIPDNAYLITVDNGISAYEAIETAKKRGMKVMVLDHHLPSTNEDGTYKLPCVDVLYDPHVDHAEWKDYCAAGVVYKLAEYIFGSCPLTCSIGILAAIGTIADMVELKGDNRNLVKFGLSLINSKNENIPVAVRTLLDVVSLSTISEQDVSFKLAPMINAPGRLKDDGAQFASDFFAMQDLNESRKMAEQLFQFNLDRQQLEKDYMEIFLKQTKKMNINGLHPLCFYQEEVPEGIVGLLAGSLVNKYKTAVFVMTNTEEGMIKGSARGADVLHVKKVLDKNAHLLAKSGGHKGAGGFSLLKENLDAFIQAVTSENIEQKEVHDYDIDIKQSEMALWYHNMSKYMPFGAGVPEPVFHIACFEAYPKYSKFAEPLGADKNHLKIYGSGCDCIGFRLYQDYVDMNQPKRVELTGNLGLNQYNGKKNIQFRIEKIAKYEMQTEKSSERKMLENLVRS